MAFAVILVAMLLIIGMGGTRSYEIAVKTSSEINTDGTLTAHVTAYISQGHTPRIDVHGGENLTVSAFSGDRVSLEQMASIEAIAFNQSLNAYVARVNMPEENQLFRVELLRCNMSALSHRFTDRGQINLSVRMEGGYVHVWGSGNDLLCLGGFYVKVAPSYSIGMRVEGQETAIIELCGANMLWRDKTLEVIGI